MAYNAGMKVLNNWRRFLLVALLAVGLGGLPACEQWDLKIEDPFEQSKADPDRPVPSYAVVAEGYNVNANRIDRLWARTKVFMQWVGEDGDERREDGEGHLMFVKPYEVALTAGKFGQTMIWAGSNADRFFLFNLSVDPSVVYWGRYDRLMGGEMTHLILPVDPRELLFMIGAMPLPEQGGHVEWYGKDLLVETAPMAGMRRWRLLLDAQTYLPQRIDRLDGRGSSQLICLLAEPEPIKQTGQALGASGMPRLATHIELQTVGKPAELRLTLQDMSDGRARNRVRPQAFNYETLKRAHKPQQEVELRVER